MLSFNINKIDTNNLNFFNILNFFLKKDLNIIKIENLVKNIIYNVKNEGDKSLFYYINKFDNLKIKDINNIILDRLDIKNFFFNLNKDSKYILECSKNRIEFYHNYQKNIFLKNWRFIETDGSVLGQKVNNINSLGYYIPAGKALYPSSIFMNSIFSNILNIKNSSIAIPLSKNKKNYNLVLAALYLSKVDNVYLMGGAHSIAALAYGTDKVLKVNKIFGPGNIYVSLAKKIIYGDSGIDMIAGPSEVLIIFDDYRFIDLLIIDLFSQCEHDNLSQSIILCSDNNILLELEKSINYLIPFMYRKNIILESFKKKSILIKTNNLIESCNIINYLSPEHLIIYSENYFNIFKYIKNSASVFLGNYNSESFGDYSIGSNHILPTYQNSKFSSPLGIYDFFKKINFSSLNYLGFKKLCDLTSNFAINEGLFAHSESILLRKYYYENIRNI